MNYGVFLRHKSLAPCGDGATARDAYRKFRRSRFAWGIQFYTPRRDAQRLANVQAMREAHVYDAPKRTLWTRVRAFLLRDVRSFLPKRFHHA